MATLISQREYARRKGWSSPYVNKLVQQGKIPTVGGKIDPRKADAALKVNRGGKIDNPPSQVPAQPAGQISPFVQARTVHETYRAKSAKLEYEQLNRKLVDSDRVIEVAEKAFANVRVRLRAIPKSLAGVLPANQNAAEIERMLSDAIDAALGSLATDVFRQ